MLWSSLRMLEWFSVEVLSLFHWAVVSNFTNSRLSLSLAVSIFSLWPHVSCTFLSISLLLDKSPPHSLIILDTFLIVVGVTHPAWQSLRRASSSNVFWVIYLSSIAFYRFPLVYWRYPHILILSCLQENVLSWLLNAIKKYSLSTVVFINSLSAVIKLP